MDLFGHTPAPILSMEVEGDKVLIGGEHKAYFVHDEIVGLYYVGTELEKDDVPYGFGETLVSAITNWLTKA